ncbi:MAG: ABC transporter permease [Candidatus Kapabacteria bacterium]|nr:ABC transporter permease [Candidatus Kapabacteria bacterium]
MILWTISRRFAQSLRADGFARFTTFVATASISVGFVALCISQSILAGYEEVIRSTAQRFGMYLTVQPTHGYAFDDTSPLQKAIDEIPGVQSTHVVLRQETLVKHGSTIDGAVITGIDRSVVVEVFAPVIVSGAVRLNEGVLIGSGLQGRLGAETGDTITLITRTASGDRPTVSRRLIAGVFTSGMTSYDDHVVLTDIRDARSILRAGPRQGSSVVVQCENDDVIPRVKSFVESAYRSRFSVMTYRDHLASIWNWIELQRRPIPVILSLIAIVSIFTVVSSLILAIVAKTRSMAILATLGMSWWRISSIVGMRALTTTLTGLGIGIALSLAFILVQRTWHPIALDGSIYYVSHLPVALDMAIIATSALLILVVSLAASVIPMLIAARVRPVQALRFG